MSQLMFAPGPADLVDVDALVSISMHEMTVVVRPTRRPDALGTQVLADVVNAATMAGSTVVLHRSGALVDADTAIVVPPADHAVSGEAAAAEAAGVGLVRIWCEGVVWTIDYASARFVRGDRLIDPLFLTAPDWTAFEAVWIGPESVRVLTADGSYIVGRRKLRHSTERADPQDDRMSLLLRHIA